MREAYVTITSRLQEVQSTTAKKSRSWNMVCDICGTKIRIIKFRRGGSVYAEATSGQIIKHSCYYLGEGFGASTEDEMDDLFREQEP